MGTSGPVPAPHPSLSVAEGVTKSLSLTSTQPWAAASAPRVRGPGSPRLWGRPTASNSSRPAPASVRMAPTRRDSAPLPPPHSCGKRRQQRAPRSARRALHSCAGANEPHLRRRPAHSCLGPRSTHARPPHVAQLPAFWPRGGRRSQVCRGPYRQIQVIWNLISGLECSAPGNSGPDQGVWPKPRGEEAPDSWKLTEALIALPLLLTSLWKPLTFKNFK